MIRAWARGPFELIVHAEGHFRTNPDGFDCRIALIGFDNAIEVAIRTFLSLHPEQRNGLAIPGARVEQACTNYHTLVDYFFERRADIGAVVPFDKADVIHVHNVRNEQYHEGRLSSPDPEDVTMARNIAVAIFSLLFDVSDCEDEISTRVVQDDRPNRNDLFDHLIDRAFPSIDVAGYSYSTSEVLYNIDPLAYQDTGLGLRDEADPSEILDDHGENDASQGFGR